MPSLIDLVVKITHIYKKNNEKKKKNIQNQYNALEKYIYNIFIFIFHSY